MLTNKHISLQAEKTNVVVLLQARMSSSRLPGKVLRPLSGSPMLLQQVNRIKQAKKVNQVIVCTSIEASDDAIEKLCNSNNIQCFRGSLNNVLDRFYKASLNIEVDHIVRLTGDCPLIDANIIDSVIDKHLEANNDYTSNCHPYTLPKGLDTEVFSKATLNKVWQLAKQKDQQEHVTLYINQNPELFKRGNYVYSIDYSNERWTVDYPEDFDLVEAIYNGLYEKKPLFDVEDIMSYLDQHPDIRMLNRQYMA